MTFILILFWFFVTFFSYDILVFVKIDQRIAERTAKMMIITNFSLPLQVANQILQTYLSSQQVTTPFFFSNIISFFITLYFGKKFIITDNYREIGFCYTRIVQELFNIIFTIVVMVIFADRESLIWPNKKLAFKNFSKHFFLCLKTSFVFYGESLAFELNTYFAARLGSISDLAVYIAINNSMMFIFYISIGFSNTFRANLGNALGAGSIQKARSNSFIYTIYVLLFSFILIFFINKYRENIAFFYSGNIETLPTVVRGVEAYYWNVFPTFILYSQNSVMRFLDKNDMAVSLNCIIMPILVVIFSGFLAFKTELRPVGLIYGFGISKIVILVFLFYIIYTVDWEKSYNKVKMKNIEAEKEFSENISKNISENISVNKD